MEAENRRIMEFARHQEHMEATRTAKMREQEEAKEHLHKIVKTTLFFFLFFLNVHTFIHSFNDTHLYIYVTPLCSLAV